MIILGSIVGVSVLLAAFVKREVLAKCFGVSRNIINQKVEKKLDSVVDIKREGQEIIKQLQKQEQDIKQRVEEAVQQVKGAEAEVRLLEANVKDYENVATLATKKGNEKDAIEALQIVESKELLIASHKETVAILQPIITDQLKFCRSLEAQRIKLNAEITQMDIREKTYKYAATMVGGETNTTFNIQELRDRVLKAQTLLETKQFMQNELGSGNAEKLKDKYSNVATLSVQERYKQLQAKVGNVVSEQ